MTWLIWLYFEQLAHFFDNIIIFQKAIDHT